MAMCMPLPMCGVKQAGAGDAVKLARKLYKHGQISRREYGEIKYRHRVFLSSSGAPGGASLAAMSTTTLSPGVSARCPTGRRGSGETTAAASGTGGSVQAAGRACKTAAAAAASGPPLDPILLEPLREPSFVFKHESRTVKFNVDSLVDYLLATGVFRDPESRLDFSEDDTRRLEALCAQTSGRTVELVSAMRQEPVHIAHARFHAEAVEGLDNLAGELVTRMLAAVEEEPRPRAPGMGASAKEDGTALVLDVFPQFAHYFSQLCAASPRYAQSCLTHYRQRLAGPPVNPTKDRAGLLPLVLDFLEEQGKCCAEGADTGAAPPPPAAPATPTTPGATGAILAFVE